MLKSLKVRPDAVTDRYPTDVPGSLLTAEESDPLKELLYEMVSMLPEEDQDLYRLYYTEGYSQEEIAEMKGVSQNTISKKLRRINKQLTEMCRKAV